ncbi:hypothetical protein L7F22_049011 [Adiantum nelumboides]|nr:hypothetical protein [Adiantum nelumboides]
MNFLYDPPKVHPSIMSSLLFEDDFSHCHWSPSSPKRCDRGQSFCMDSMALQWNSRPCRESTRPLEHLFSFCTEELGSESTSGVGHASTAPMSQSYSNIFHENHISSMPAEAAPRIWTSMHQLHPTKASEEAVPPAISRKLLHSCSSDGDALSQCIPNGHCLRRGGNVRTFPPPLSSLLCDRPLMRSFKSNDRFTLKRIDNVSCSLFRFSRKDGRLRLELLSSPHDGLHDQCSRLFPASPAGLLQMSAPSVERHHYPLYIPPISLLKWNSSSYNTLSSKAVAMLTHSKSPVGPVEESKPAVSCSSPLVDHIAECAKNVKTKSTLCRRLPAPRVFALLNLLPAGLGLIILEFGQSKYGSFFTLHGVYILKGLGLQWTTRDSMVLLRYPFCTNLCGVDVQVPEKKLFTI